jgi:hypothetical protein
MLHRLCVARRQRTRTSAPLDHLDDGGVIVGVVRDVSTRER